ncbi:MAG: quinone-dependent dihydroorotate dehydrogenase [Bacteroidales bacterium]|nr:quinone-dependent dihydroorotate dehydrogenase [Bacteroidales bacterium]
MYRHIIRPLLFLLPPERIHGLVAFALRLLCKIPGCLWLLHRLLRVSSPVLERELLGMRFTSPVGLAAGLDKNAEFFEAIGALGFAFVEVGTVTPKPQPGNPKPRSFRLVADGGLINRMGFNNKGVDYVKHRLSRNGRRPKNLIVGGNIGKNTATPNADAPHDYALCCRELYPHVDYLAVNVSCPNVSSLRDLQAGSELAAILGAVMAVRAEFEQRKPVLLKVSPDLSSEQLRSTVEVAERCGIDGYIATNTTTNREGLRTSAERLQAIGNGGLSGAPLAARATAMVRELRSVLGPDRPIIGVGGIMNEHDALERLRAGADLVQLYTGFVYGGPAMARRINRAILKQRR